MDWKEKEGTTGSELWLRLEAGLIGFSFLLGSAALLRHALG